MDEELILRMERRRLENGIWESGQNGYCDLIPI